MIALLNSLDSCQKLAWAASLYWNTVKIGQGTTFSKGNRVNKQVHFNFNFFKK